MRGVSRDFGKGCGFVSRLSILHTKICVTALGKILKLSNDMNAEV